MSVKKFKFVSPGVFLREIDNSQLPKIPRGIGPVVIGRFRQGPAMKPVQVSDLSAFEGAFGITLPGQEGQDPWREGNGLQASAPAPYAAHSYFREDEPTQGPLTVVRLLGVQDDNAGDSGQAGWSLGTDGKSFGIFVIPTTSSLASADAFLAGIVYSTDANFSIGVYGTDGAGQAITPEECLVSASTNTPKPVKIGASLEGEHLRNAFGLNISNSSGQRPLSVSFEEQNPKTYIRKQLNTNPVLTNTRIKNPPSGSLAESYWLGETFDNSFFVEKSFEENRVGGQKFGHEHYVFVAKLNDVFEDFMGANHQLSQAKSGWVIGQHVGDAGSFDPERAQKLFRIVSLQDGEQGNSQYVQIEDISIKTEGDPDPYGTFNLAVYYTAPGMASPRLQERWTNLNLNPNSSNYIARVIGDRYFEWDSVAKVNRSYNSYDNTNPYIRVEMHSDVEEGDLENVRAVPFGFLGPVVPQHISAISASDGIYTMGGSGLDKWIDGKVDLSDFRGEVHSTAPTTFTVRWPTLPQVMTGSQRPEDDDKFYFGASPYRVSGLGQTELYNLSPLAGKCDYYRRMPESSFLSPQIAGTADTPATVRHSYVFSLDQVVVTGAAAPPETNLDEFAFTAVYHKSGSHGAEASSTATIKIATANPVNFNGANDLAAAAAGEEAFTLVSLDGVSRTYRFQNDGGGAHATGEKIAAQDDQIRIRVDGKNTHQLIAAEVKAAIESANGHQGKLTATIGTTTNAGDTITVTQVAVGTAGDTTIVVSCDDAAKFTVNGGIVNTTFTGGQGPTEAYTSLSSGSAGELVNLVNNFRVPMCGGFDGVDITEADPFNMSADALGPDDTALTSYAYASVERAIDMIRDPEIVEHQLALMPGITNEALSEKLVRVCEARGDSLAIIDLPNVYIPPSQEKCGSFKDRVSQSSARKAAAALKKRQINSSYGCTYYPWVKIRDPYSNQGVWVPPSVTALGAMSYTDSKKKPWFAPAGFTRGGLTREVVGLAVEGVSEHLLSKDRDLLYEANINPIASFVSEGLVIFGQKTLQMTKTALDRINVRRLLIFVKKRISKFSSELLFDQNVPATWARFTGKVVPFLEEVKTEFGLTDFKVVLDDTTTTPDLIDRNIMYAKIFLKPARSIEFIAIDFVITRTGAGYND